MTDPVLAEQQRRQLVAGRHLKRPWHELLPGQATGIELPHPEIWGPLSEAGGECP